MYIASVSIMCTFFSPDIWSVRCVFMHIYKEKPTRTFSLLPYIFPPSFFCSFSFPPYCINPNDDRLIFVDFFLLILKWKYLSLINLVMQMDENFVLESTFANEYFRPNQIMLFCYPRFVNGLIEHQKSQFKGLSFQENVSDYMGLYHSSSKEISEEIYHCSFW